MQDNEKLIKLGKYLKSLRVAEKLTLDNVAYKSGVDPTTLSRVEKAEVEVKYLTLSKIAKTLKADPTKMFF